MGVAREQFAGGTLGSRAARTEPTLNMCQPRKGTRTETWEVLEGGMWKYSIALMIYVPYSYILYILQKQ